MRDKSERPGSGPEEQDAIKLQLINDSGLRIMITVSLYDIQDLQNPLTIGKYPELLLEQEHIISQIPDLLINVEALTGTDHLDTTVTLELEPITNSICPQDFLRFIREES